ncbi:MAG TPA: NrsF family protein [Steroidobacteraceae bacterium]|nr:NrsF family protein [Steroidobacteraceae bacterium]
MATTPSERLYPRIRAAVEATPAATTRTRTRIFAALAIVPLLTAAVVLIVSEMVYGQPTAGLRLDVSSVVAMLTILGLIAALALASTLFALWQGRDGLGIGSISLVSIVALVVPVYAALTVLRPLHSGAADDVALTGVAISPWGLRCLFVATLVGVPALVIFAAALRRAAAVSSSLRGAALGAAAGAWAGFAVFVFCPSGNLQHLLVGHVLPIAIFTLIGAVAVTRALRP